jgi:hypothetical protein
MIQTLYAYMNKRKKIKTMIWSGKKILSVRNIQKLFWEFFFFFPFCWDWGLNSGSHLQSRHTTAWATIPAAVFVFDCLSSNFIWGFVWLYHFCLSKWVGFWLTLFSFADQNKQIFWHLLEAKHFSWKKLKMPNWLTFFFK